MAGEREQQRWGGDGVANLDAAPSGGCAWPARIFAVLADVSVISGRAGVASGDSVGAGCDSDDTVAGASSGSRGSGGAAGVGYWPATGVGAGWWAA